MAAGLTLPAQAGSRLFREFINDRLAGGVESRASDRRCYSKLLLVPRRG